ncbi:MAG: hypothetical protein ABIS49_11795 [Aestuariivirga sp.]
MMAKGRLGEKLQPMSSIKREFVAVYDYGQGGVWFLIIARSRQEIEGRFSFLKVFEEKPDIVTWEISNEFRQDIDSPNVPMLAKILKEVST